MGGDPPPPVVDDVEEEGGATKIIKVVMKYLFSHVGLCVLVCAYCVGGAFLFMHLEGEGEEEALLAGLNRSQEIEEERLELAKNLWKHKWSNKFNATVKTLLDEYHANLTDAIANHGYSGTRINSTDEFTYGWSFPSALLFTVTIVTTIGYGHIAPKTEIGQLVVIIYSLLGIPLMLMFLANIGDAMANFFRVAYGRGCCYFCWKQRQKNYEISRQQARRGRVGGSEGGKSREGWGSRDVSPARPGTGASRLSVDDLADAVPAGGGRVAEIEDPEEEVINVPISLTLVIIAAYIFIGAVLFAAWNDWSWITGAYFSFVTLSTIGFGDLVPGWSEVGTTIGKVKLAISAFYIILGLAVLSMSFNLMMEEMIAKFRWLGKKLGIIDDAPAAAAASNVTTNPGTLTSTDKDPLVANDFASATSNLPSPNPPPV